MEGFGGLSYKPRFEVESQGPEVVSSNLTLCYTTNFQAPESANVFYVIPLTFDCGSHPCIWTPDEQGSANLEINLYNTNLTSITTPGSAFFLCFTNQFVNFTANFFTCESYSPYFHISYEPASLPNQKRDDPAQLSFEAASASAFAASFISSIEGYIPPTATLSITASTAILLPSGGTVLPPSTTASDSPVSTSWAATVTTPDITPTATATGAANTSDTSSSPHSSRLSLGAKVGIALGAIILAFLIILAILLLLRYRRRNPPPNSSRTPENPLLSSSLQNNDSRELFVAEKLGLTDRTDTNTPLTSRGAGVGVGGRYDHEANSTADLPAPGSAFTANTLVPINPQRSQAANTLRSDGNGIENRAVSMASEVSRPVSPVNEVAVGGNTRELSREISRERIGERSIFDQEPYTDGIDGAGQGTVNVGGNESRMTLEVPKVYKGTLQAPFLSEPGMSPEEVARLEEEERRIDEAIAEADEERRRAREAREARGR
ncbi:hypothetical protein EYC80_005505 [Monilinia laxa]|uniref:Mid2 domain-containing protein n=1 Tax=Monilinia laxa TaxID=61186 RepID=A0A5N6KE86_MONLA|nr:hypothetical protein EYC80_005505 [Monilinia laxa]